MQRQFSRLICKPVHTVSFDWFLRDLSRDDWIEEFIKRKWSSGLFWAVGAAEKKKTPNCHKYATFQCGHYNVFKFFFFFFPTKSWKNLPQKLLITGPNLFSHSPAQATANSPKSIFHIIKMSHQTSVLLSVNWDVIFK